jgi:hypothetical protein
MRIEAITIYKSQKAAGVSLPFPRLKILKISRVYNVQCTSKNYDCKKMGMTIGGTNQAAMVLILRSFMVRLQRRRAYLDEG